MYSDKRITPLSARTDALGFRGAKHTCTNDACARRFYDLTKLPTACPYCGTFFDKPEVVLPVASSARRGKYQSYKLLKDVAPIDEPAVLADLAVADGDDKLAEDVNADEIPEIEEEEEASALPSVSRS